MATIEKVACRDFSIDSSIGCAMRTGRLLHRSLNYVPVTMTFAMLILVSIYFMFVTADSELAPLEDQGVILIASDSASNTSPEQLSRYTAALTKAYEAFDETDQTFLFNGSQGSGPATVRNKALSGIVLDAVERTRPYADRVMLPLVQQTADRNAGLKSAAFGLPPMPGAGGGLPVQFVIGSTESPRARSTKWLSSCWARPGKAGCSCLPTWI